MADPLITPDPLPSSPYIPSEHEARLYLHGVACQNPGYQLVARTTPDIWAAPLQDYGVPLPRKHLSPFGKQKLSFQLWEESVAPALGEYLFKESVLYSSLLPVCIGPGPSYPVIMVAVMPDSLSRVDGLKHALHCQLILTRNGIQDMYIIIYESVYHFQASLMQPCVALDPVADIADPFSTSLGVPISILPHATHEGTGSLFLVDSSAKGPEKVAYMLVPRHVVFTAANNANYVYDGIAANKVIVVFMGHETFGKCCNDIEIQIADVKHQVVRYKGLLEAAAQRENEEEAAAQRRRATSKLDNATERLEGLQSLLAHVTTHFGTPEQRTLGHVAMSPPLAFGVGEESATEDWALVEMNPSAISQLNCIGNVIDVRSMSDTDMAKAMQPRPSNVTSFKQPADGLLRLTGMASDQEMATPHLQDLDRDLDPVIMVIKNGSTSGLTVGRLNNIRSCNRRCGQLAGKSMEIAVLPRQPDYRKSIPFSVRGDSGSVVVDGKGRVCGMLTSGHGDDSLVSDITYVTSINFLLKRLADHGIQANIFPLPSDLPQ
jgi:hypothetical protein